jgi:RND family efflux transporter MFP subunit
VKEKIVAAEMEIAKLDTSKKEDKSKMVAVTEMLATTFSHYIEVQAKVDGDEDVNVNAEMPGVITSVLAKAGDHVSKGEVLATMDDRAIRQSLDALKVQRDMAVTMFDKQQNLWNQKIGSEVQFIQARSQKESIEKQCASLQAQWEMTRIKSPISGTVDEVDVKLGSATAPGYPAFRVVNLSNLKVKGEVAESFISKVKTGSDVILFFPDQNKEVKTKLTYSGQAVNKLNRTFNVEAAISPKDGNFFPNQVVILKIVDYVNPNSFIVPVSSLMKSSDGEYVFVASNENGKMISKRKIISSGMTYNGIAEIKTGIESGDKIITTGNQNLVEGDLIRF